MSEPVCRVCGKTEGEHWQRITEAGAPEMGTYDKQGALFVCVSRQRYDVLKGAIEAALTLYQHNVNNGAVQPTDISRLLMPGLRKVLDKEYHNAD
jgi:hypothetical protein